MKEELLLVGNNAGLSSCAYVTILSAQIYIGNSINGYVFRNDKAR